MVVGVLRLELHVPNAQSLKERRFVIKSFKDQLRGKFNVAVAEIDPNDTWQRATLGISTVGEDRTYVQGIVEQVMKWVRATHLVDLIRVEQEYM